MDSFQSLPSLLLLLLTATSLLVQPSFSIPHQSLNTKLGFRVGATHVDYGKNLTKLQLVQRSLHRGRARLEMFTKMATTASGNNIQAPTFPGSGEFLMNMSIGTPAVPMSAILDTGSDLIWTQCMPCTKCFDQPTPVFDTTKSSTCSNVSCTSDLCQDMNVFKCTDGCKYLYSYGDESSTEGFMTQDTFTFEDSGSGPVSIPNIGFGCGVNNQGTGFGQGSGLVGLGRGPLSLVSQLGLGKFSYCLTSISENKTSNVLFGALADLNYSTSGASHRTPLVQNPFQPSFYYVSLEGITIGETLLPMPKSTMKLKEDGSGGMIIDSGTTLTYLQEEAFRALKMEFKSQMKLRVSESSDTIGLDLCFDLPTEDLSEIAVPKLKLHFEGVDLELPPENYMISDPSMGVVCLAMAASSRMSILGNIQQQNLLVLHDLEKETVSFIPTQCDQL
ncbi:aspartic proteinase nepenthesin-1-like [Actinidia eriantha]|uniref:aspartic proteinase nepenthesin-1-like n=1 Tax=Actinidia eriantha TaxID=165200 RepID=UPI0025900638|nr:aspartic proteinase nepenthesin-1-like [Actinidia eriantha]